MVVTAAAAPGWTAGDTGGDTEALPLVRLDDREPKLAVEFGLSMSGMRPFAMVAYFSFFVLVVVVVVVLVVFQFMSGWQLDVPRDWMYIICCGGHQDTKGTMAQIVLVRR